MMGATGREGKLKIGIAPRLPRTVECGHSSPRLARRLCDDAHAPSQAAEVVGATITQTLVGRGRAGSRGPPLERTGVIAPLIEPLPSPWLRDRCP